MKKRYRDNVLYASRIALLGVAVCLATALIWGWHIAHNSPQPPPSSKQINVYMPDGSTRAMELEEYIIGVVGAEMPASFPIEALKAQAVAARTYAIRRTGDPCGRGGADICTDSTCCQAYRSHGQLEEKLAGGNYMDKLTEAVYSTAGEIAVYGGEPIEALYHSSSGGHTEDAQNVFSAAKPYLKGVDSPGEEQAKKYRGEKNWSAGEFASVINKKWKKAGLKRKKLKEQIEILSRYPSGRVETLRLGGVKVSGRELRKALGLNSANFTIDIGDRVTVCTVGYGHGVGMSQYGARAMALDGAGYKEILEHYYSGIEVENYDEKGIMNR